ncbi:MAG TPA: hypothetical protein VJB15_12125 [Rhodothermia bacterium]|nr:hypothetical protein [Rhodothermia bacterium]
MRRILLAALLIAHGLAHASAGIWVSAGSRWWIASSLWWIAAIGFSLVGISLLGVGPILRWWRPLVVVSSLASLVLIVMGGERTFAIGGVIDLVALFVALRKSVMVDVGFWDRPHPPRAVRFMLAFFVGYVALVTGTRHWYMNWGSTNEDRRASLPGDPPGVDARYRIDHVVTINAPADSVWPWLAQLGQDRGGFYSHDWLERVFGDHVTNAQRIHPEWQQRQVGDLVRSAQPGYLGGILGPDPGWRITELEPGRAMVLEGWGAFVLRPLDEQTTRLHIRTRGSGAASIAMIPLAPLGILVYEPAHFIMERRMMLGIKERAERMMDI